MTSPTLPALDPGVLSATAEPRGTTGIDRRPRIAQYLANAIVTVVFLGTSVNTMIVVLQTSLSPIVIAYGELSALAVVAIQLHYCRPSTRLYSRSSRVLLAIQAVLAYLPILPFGYNWIATLVYVAGSALLVLPPRIAWPVVAAITASMPAVEIPLRSPPLYTVYDTIGCIYWALALYLLTRLVRTVADLHQTRTELALRAVAEQRLAFAKDLHDLLGLSLSAIALKGELVHRLLQKSAERAKAELAEITGIAQRTLSDVRSVARGYRELTLEKESRTAESLLTASDIAVRVHLEHRDLPVQTRTMVAKVLREGVTNVLRFSNVERCEIAMRQQSGKVSLEIVNDGVDEDQDFAATPDTMTALFTEVSALGGTMRAGRAEDGRFRLSLELPLPDDTSAGKVTPRRERAQEAAQPVRRLMTAAFCLVICLAVVHLLLLTRDVWLITFDTGCLLALLALQLSYFNRPATRLRSPLTYALLFVQACLIYLPLIPMQRAWASQPGLVFGCALLVLPPVVGWTVFVVGNAGFLWIELALGIETQSAIYFTVGVVFASLLVFGLVWLVRLAAELDATRLRLAEMAVAEERLRFARDLHDLLGMTLSAITLKSELTSRILPIDQTKAAEELAEILSLTRQALADVRSVASGHRELSLEDESRSARSVLAAADVRVQVEMLNEKLPVPVGTVLAVVLREGITNMLRHSEVENCEITVRRTPDGVILDIVNDGVATNETPRADRPTPAKAIVLRQDPSGSGIQNMLHRVANLGGELTAEEAPDGRFRLRAVVPV